jgi:hypothetical protein
MFPGTYTLVIVAKDDSKQQIVGVGSRTLQVVDSDVHVTVPIGKPGEVRGRATVQAPGGASLSDLQLVLRSLEGSAARSSIDASGNFDFSIVPGHQVFELLGPSKKVYVKQARCSGQNYTTEPLTIQAGQVVNSCDVTLATDTGVVNGSVSKSGKPAAGMVAVLVPQRLGLRGIGRYTLTAMTDADGHFQLEGVIPGDYFLFAVPLDINAHYFAHDFADRNQSDAQSISVKANEIRVVSLTPTTQQ